MPNQTEGMNMKICNEQRVLDAIYDFALELQCVTDVEELHRGLNEIQAMARYGFDVRAQSQAQQSAGVRGLCPPDSQK
jgi:hypothetical protein